MKKLAGALLLMLLMFAGLTLWLRAATPSWIQYSERVVGEGSPYYVDVVNRPAKQIWANFTSEHTSTGAHKLLAWPTAIPTLEIPTPLPTATPIVLPTPKPDATPQPTCTPVIIPTPLPTATPKPDATPQPTATPVTIPTPLPTPTPVPNIATHTTDMTMHGSNLPTPVIISATATLSYTYCYGQVVLVDGAAKTITLPTRTNAEANNIWEVSFVIISAASLDIAAGANTTIISTGGVSYTNLNNTGTLGNVITLRYLKGAYQWVVMYTRGTWTAS